MGAHMKAQQRQGLYANASGITEYHVASRLDVKSYRASFGILTLSEAALQIGQ